MTLSHEPWLVFLSLLVAVQGSYVGLSLARNFHEADGFRRRALLAGASLTLATGVWSMHFVGMLAAQFPSPIDYLVFPTLLSFLICVIVVGVGVYAAHTDGPLMMRIGGGALAMGLGISLMHYVGMRAVHLAGPTSQETPFVVLSVVISVAASGIALWTLERRATRSRVLGAAIVLGLAISGMHYTAMAGMRLDPLCFDVTRFVAADSSLSRNTLALLTTMIAFGVSAAFLLSLVPDGATLRLQPAVKGLAPKDPAVVDSVKAGVDPASSAPAKAAAIARSANLADPEPGTARDQRRRANSVSVEKDGRAREISVDDIFAVRANAHYSYVHDGEHEYFCGLTISAIEARLDPARFMRVHRSHIVAIDRVVSLRRAGENGVAELAAPVRCSIPIARSHFRQVKQLVEARTA
jgi:NO-binding membrane sensor protein with MHYT domain